MAITYVGGVSGAATNNGDVSLDLTALTGGSDSSPSQDDLVVVTYGLSTADNTDFNMAMITSGYTEVADLFADDTVEAQLGAYWKFMGASPDATAQVDGLGGTDTAVAACAMVFRGVALVADGGPFDTTATTATGINTMHPDPPSIDHSGAAGVVVVIGTVSGTNIGTTTVTMPTGYTTDALKADQTDTDGRVFATMGYRDSGVSDPEDPGTVTINGADSSAYAWAAVTMALKPAAGVISGSAASVVNVSSAADGDTLVQGAAASTVQASSAADGDVLVQGAAASTVGVVLAADGDVLVQGAGASVAQVTQAATGTVANPASEGAIDSLVHVTQAADGDVLVQGAAASVVQAQSAADGDVAAQGAAASVVQAQSTADGDVLVQGPAATLVSVAGNASGSVPVQGAAATSVQAASAASGVVEVKGAAASSVQVGQAAAGTVTDGPSGAAAVVVHVGQAADGDVLVQGSAGVLVGVAAAASGTVELIVPHETQAESKAWWQDRLMRGSKAGMRLTNPGPVHTNDGGEDNLEAQRYARWLDGKLD